MFRCLIATLGKDAPGVNATVRAATRLALRRGLDVFGARRGFPGIVNGTFHKMKESEVGFILGRGGSLLGSVDFRVPYDAPDTISRIGAGLKKFDLVVASGGLGTYSILSQVYETQNMGTTTTMFVPASVENEFLHPAGPSRPEGTVHAEAIGADTAANTAIEAIDRLREQSYLSRTLFVMQIVGAKSNYLPIQIGVSCGAHRIYLPQYPLLGEDAKTEIAELFGPGFNPLHLQAQELVAWVEKMFDQSQKTYLTVVIPNGIPMVDVVVGRGEETPRENYEDIVRSMAPLEFTVLRLVDNLLVHFSRDGSVQIRYVVLDDLQRGGAPSLRDRVLGTLYGEAAVEEFLSVVNGQDVQRRGNLNLLGVEETCSSTWKCYSREQVRRLFSGEDPRAGGLDPLPFFRQLRGTVSGYRPLARV